MLASPTMNFDYPPVSNCPVSKLSEIKANEINTKPSTLPFVPIKTIIAASAPLSILNALETV